VTWLSYPKYLVTQILHYTYISVLFLFITQFIKKIQCRILLFKKKFIDKFLKSLGG